MYTKTHVITIRCHNYLILGSEPLAKRFLTNQQNTYKTETVGWRLNATHQQNGNFFVHYCILGLKQAIYEDGIIDLLHSPLPARLIQV